MHEFEKNADRFLNSLSAQCTQETLDYIMEELRQSMDEEEVPTEEAVRSFFLSPEQPTSLTDFQKALAMDKLLEWIEVNLRTICDLIRYRYWKRAGAVSSVDEFLELFRPDADEG